MGWAILAFLIAASLALLWVAKVRGGLLTASAAALLFGGAGYALQGSPDVPAAPASGSEYRNEVSLTPVRHAFFGNFSPEESWLNLAEGLERSGSTEDAVGLLQNAVRRYPTDGQLWIGLGNALVDHAHGLTPPAEYAFRRAKELMPENHPAPRFFYDLALARSGQGDVALKDLLAILRENPGASWRPMVAELALAIVNNGNRQPAQPVR